MTTKSQEEMIRMPEAPTKVGLYTRISTDEAHQPYSLGAQRDRLRSYVKSQENWKVIRTYEDQITGTVLNRPGLQDALADAKKGEIDLLLVFRVDRLARSVRSLAAILEDLDNYGVAFRSATEPFDTTSAAGRMMVQMLGVFAEFERATLIERITAGMARKAAGGGWNGVRPFGYDYDSDTGALKVNLEQAPIVLKMFNLYVEQRQGITSIARWLNENGHRNKNGKLWRPNAVRIVITNRAYIGEVPWKDRSYPGMHQPLIEKDTFEEAQRLLELRGRKASCRRTNPTDFVLTGVLSCESCGRPFSGTTARGNGGTYRYYTCQSRVEYGTDHCDMERLPADDIERDIRAHAIQTLRNPKILREAFEMHLTKAQKSVPQGRAEIRKLEKDVRKIRATIDDYLSAFESAKLPPEVCAPRLEELNSQLLEARARIEQLKDESHQVERLPDIEEIEAIGESLAKILESLGEEDNAKYKAVLRIVVPQVLVGSRQKIRPTIQLPLVRVNDSKVGADRFEPVTPALVRAKELKPSMQLHLRS